MTLSRSCLTLSGAAILTLSLGSNAYAAGGREAEAGRSFPVTSGPLVTVVAANHRETNLSKTATSIIVMGVQSATNSPEQR